MMNYFLIIGIESGVCLLLIILFVVYRHNIGKKIGKNETILEQITKNEGRLCVIRTELIDSTKKSKTIKHEIESNETLVEKTFEKRKRVEAELQNILNNSNEAQEKYKKVSNDTIALQKLKVDSDQMEKNLHSSSERLKQVNEEILNLEEKRLISVAKVQDLMARVDLYSRLEEYVSYGHFEEPDYLYETSERFAEEIKRLREKQKQFLKNKTAVTYPSSIAITSDEKTIQNILDGQISLMLAAFNIECDYLIGKVKPSTFGRTLEQIEYLATKLEKSAASLHCGFNTEYVKLKYEECKIQYQFTLKKQDEQDEQRLINEQIREEIKAQKEFERAISEAEKEERIYRKMLELAKESLEKATDDERIVTQLRIKDLEQQLAEAIAKEERVKSLAEQTRRGHVYVISNIGSFGEGIFKIGLTRRLDPIDRVKELGDASVPFKFDVHAIIYAEDAPALEATLHRTFKCRRINGVNFRKEFFRVDLHEVKKAVEQIVGNDIDFKMTALAEEYYETRRLQPEMIIQ